MHTTDLLSELSLVPRLLLSFIFGDGEKKSLVDLRRTFCSTLRFLVFGSFSNVTKIERLLMTFLSIDVE